MIVHDNDERSAMASGGAGRRACVMRFGSLVRTRRKARGWSIERLAQESNLSPHYISNLENDQRDPSLSTIEALASAFGLAPADLLVEGGSLSPHALDAAQLFERVSPDVQASIVQLLTAIACSTTDTGAKKIQPRTRRRAGS